MDNRYIEEIRLSRELTRAIESELASFGKVIPEPVYRAYIKLQELYRQQMVDNLM